MTKVMLGGVCLALLWLVIYQGGIIAHQRSLICDMMQNPACQVPGK